MSRSYKKNPVVKDSPKMSHKSKMIASRITRRKLNSGEVVTSHRGYRRVVSPWLIHDYISRWSREDAIMYYNDRLLNRDSEGKFSAVDDRFFAKYPTVEDYLNKSWAKVRRK